MVREHVRCLLRQDVVCSQLKAHQRVHSQAQRGSTIDTLSSAPTVASPVVQFHDRTGAGNTKCDKSQQTQSSTPTFACT